MTKQKNELRNTEKNNEVVQGKNWTKTKKGDYIFTVDGVERGTMSVSSNTLEASAELDGKKYKLKRLSYWKLNLVITDDTGKEVIKINQEKWFSSKWELTYNFKKYRLILRNKLYSSYVILDGEHEILTYGMAAKCTPALKITGTTEEKDFILDFLVWYLYAPIYLEDSGEDLSWIVAAVA